MRIGGNGVQRFVCLMLWASISPSSRRLIKTNYVPIDYESVQDEHFKI